MPLSDLLWACPECGEDRGLIDDRPGHRCRRCRTRFRRDEGARIRAERPDGSRTVLEPRAWLERLPTPGELVRERTDGRRLLRSARVLSRWVTGFEAVHGEDDGYLNRIELWGDENPGRLELHPERLVLIPDGEETDAWPLETLTAVQASSSTLQINRRAAPLVSFRFLDDSIFLWENLLHEVLARFYRTTGRGEIVEFQPRIVTA